MWGENIFPSKNIFPNKRIIQGKDSVIIFFEKDCCPERESGFENIFQARLARRVILFEYAFLRPKHLFDRGRNLFPS